jgi:uncharacterized protein
MKIDDQTIILTGAASGIGFALLQMLNAYPCRVLAVDLKPIPTLAEGRATIQPMTADLSEADAVDRICDRALADFGPIDIFIANAGFAYYETVEKADYAHIECIYRVNVFAPLYIIAKMRELNPEREHMTAITGSSMAFLPLAGYAHYGATKAAINHFSVAYRLEPIPKHARLLMVYPIATRTAFFQTAHQRAPVLHPNQTADYVAGRILAGIRNNRRHVNPSPGFLGFRLLGRFIPLLFPIYQAYTAWLVRRWRRKQG